MDVHTRIQRDATEMAKAEGRAPEQSDFLTAAILNQSSMSPTEWAELQADLQAIELGTSTERPGVIETTEEYDDPAWCYKCNRDTAFCLCKCYICYRPLEECECTCAQCSTPIPGGGLCEVHKAAWVEEVQGPEPEEPHQVGICERCGIPFSRSFELDAPWSLRIQPIYNLTDRTLCIACDTEGKFKGSRPQTSRYE